MTALSPVRRTRALAIPLLALALLGAACGGGGGDGSDEVVALGPDASFSSTTDLTDPPSSWEGTALGLIRTDVSSFNDETGTCLVLVGSATPTEGPSTGPMSLSMRDFWLEVEGQWYVPDDNTCDTTAMQEAGYDWMINVMDVPFGTPYPFFEEFFIPVVEDATPTRVTYGPAAGGFPDTIWFEPTILTEVPAP